MCGIAGILRFDDKLIERSRLEAMQARVAHRGPDGQGVGVYPHCGLAHTRLAVLDQAGGAQPMTLDHLHVVFNGEVYNHRALRRQLEQRGCRFSSDHSDTEVLLHGYQAWGRELPKHLEGMFAFAIWDANARELFLARDRIGKKPLFVRRAGDELTFASLISVIGRDAKVDRAALLTYLRLGYTFEQSLAKDVDEIPAAHWMLIDAQGRTTCEAYWKQPQDVSDVSPGDLRSALETAVRTRLEADVPIGCFLSGGIDSSLIAAIAQRQGGQRLRTFSVAMPAAAYDESAFAKQVADHIDADHTVLQADPSDAMADLEHLMTLTGEPTADSSLLPTYWLCRAARQHVTVAISGDGGDELFGGYNRYLGLRKLAAHRAWLQYVPTAWLRNAPAYCKRTRLRRMAEAARHNTLAGSYQSMVHLFTENEIRQLGLNTDDEPAVQLAAGDAARAAMRWDLAHYLPFDVLRKVDRASMAVALEVRCPLLDTRVVEAASQLDAGLHFSNGQSKAVLRQLAAELLPKQIARKPKQGFAIPVGQWLRTSWRDAAEGLLHQSQLETIGFDPRCVRKWFKEHQGGRIDRAHQLFALLQLELWLRWRRA